MPGRNDPSFFAGLEPAADQQASRTSGGVSGMGGVSPVSISPGNSAQNPNLDTSAPAAPSASPAPTTQPVVSAPAAATLASVNSPDAYTGGGYNLSTTQKPSLSFPTGTGSAPSGGTGPGTKRTSGGGTATSGPSKPPVTSGSSNPVNVSGSNRTLAGNRTLGVIGGPVRVNKYPTI